MRKIALVIGLEYSGEYKLNGCYNDALNVISTIKNLYKFTNNEIIFLNDRDSNKGSKKYIKECLNYVADGDYDFSFFYYAGHGSYIRDRDGDEGNLISKVITQKNSLNKDSYLCTSESNGSIGVFKDDEINTILSKIKAKNTLLGFIDCCHSGTMFDCNYIYFPNKINNKKCKSNKINYLINNYQKEFNLINSKYDNFNRTQGNIILLSAARDNQYSYESKLQGKNQGNFTYNACRLLNRCKHQKISIETFIILVSGMINDEKQLPVCTSSKFFDLKNSYIFNNQSGLFDLKQGILSIEDNLSSNFELPSEEISIPVIKKKNNVNPLFNFFSSLFGNKNRSLNNIPNVSYLLIVASIYKLSKK